MDVKSSETGPNTEPIAPPQDNDDGEVKPIVKEAEKILESQVFYYDKETDKYTLAQETEKCLEVHQWQPDSKDVLVERRSRAFEEMEQFDKLGDKEFDNLCIEIFKKVLERQGIKDMNSAGALHYLQEWQIVRTYFNENPNAVDSDEVINKRAKRMLEMTALVHDLEKKYGEPGNLISHAHKSSQSIPDFMHKVFVENGINGSFDNVFAQMSTIDEVHSGELEYIKARVQNPKNFIEEQGMLGFESGDEVPPLKLVELNGELVAEMPAPEDLEDDLTRKMAEILLAADTYSNYGFLKRNEIDLPSSILSEIKLDDLQIGGFVKILMFNLLEKDKGEFKNTFIESLKMLLDNLKKSKSIFESIPWFKGRMNKIEIVFDFYIDAVVIANEGVAKVKLGDRLVTKNRPMDEFLKSFYREGFSADEITIIKKTYENMQEAEDEQEVLDEDRIFNLMRDFSRLVADLEL
jgi:hypothetical protein